MKKTTYYTPLKSLRRLFNFKLSSKKPIENELVHPRFMVSESDLKSNKNASKSLLFLMYSKENESLFI